MLSKRLSELVRTWVPRSVRNWLRAPGRSCVWLWNEGRSRMGMNPVVALRPGWAVKCHPNAYRFLIDNQVKDAEQRLELDTFIHSIGPETNFFDVGCHFGVFSLAAAHYGGSAARIVAVDAPPVALRIMAAHCRLNSVPDEQVTLVHSMAGASVGQYEMVAVGVIGWGYFVKPGAQHGQKDVSVMPMTTVDHLAAQYRCAPTHLKIDVEGAEQEVIQGAAQCLASPAGPIVFLELHNAIIRREGGDPASVLHQLAAHGYRFEHIDNQPIRWEDACLPDVIRLVGRKEQL